jgi:hypothetical protein
VLQCMQRLASHPGLAEQLLAVPGLLTRLWTLAAAGIGAGAAKAAAAATAKAANSGGVAAGGDGQLGGGDDHVTAEVGRLLLRLWAPSAARRGSAPWRVARGEREGPGACGVEEGRAATPAKHTVTSDNHPHATDSLLAGGLLVCSPPSMPVINSVSMLAFCDRCTLTQYVLRLRSQPPCAGPAVGASVAAATAAAAAATAADELAAAAAEDGATARSAKLLCFPPNLMSHRLGLLLGPLGVHPPVSPLTSMCLLEAVAALAVGEHPLGGSGEGGRGPGS